MASLSDSYLDDVSSYLFAHCNDALAGDVRAIEERVGTLIRRAQLVSNDSTVRSSNYATKFVPLSSILNFSRSRPLLYAIRQSVFDVLSPSSEVLVSTPTASLVAAQRLLDIMAAHDATALSPETAAHAPHGGPEAAAASAAPSMDARLLHALARVVLSPDHTFAPSAYVPPKDVEPPISTTDSSDATDSVVASAAVVGVLSAILKESAAAATINRTTFASQARRSATQPLVDVPQTVHTSWAHAMGMCGVVGWTAADARRNFLAAVEAPPGTVTAKPPRGGDVLGRLPCVRGITVDDVVGGLGRQWVRSVVTEALLTEDGWLSVEEVEEGLCERSTAAATLDRGGGAFTSSVPSGSNASAGVRVRERLVGPDGDGDVTTRDCTGCPTWPLLYIALRCGLYECAYGIATDALRSADEAGRKRPGVLAAVADVLRALSWTRDAATDSEVVEPWYNAGYVARMDSAVGTADAPYTSFARSRVPEAFSSQDAIVSGAGDAATDYRPTSLQGASARGFARLSPRAADGTSQWSSRRVPDPPESLARSQRVTRGVGVVGVGGVRARFEIPDLSSDPHAFGGWGVFVYAVVAHLGLSTPLSFVRSADAVATAESLFVRVGAADIRGAMLHAALLSTVCCAAMKAAEEIVSHHSVAARDGRGFSSQAGSGVGSVIRSLNTTNPVLASWVAVWSAVVPNVCSPPPSYLLKAAVTVTRAAVEEHSPLAPAIAALLCGDVPCAVTQLLQVSVLAAVDTSVDHVGGDSAALGAEGGLSGDASNVLAYARHHTVWRAAAAAASVGPQQVSLLNVAPAACASAVGSGAVWRADGQAPCGAVWDSAIAAAAAASAVDAAHGGGGGSSSARATDASAPFTDCGDAFDERTSLLFGGCGAFALPEAWVYCAADALVVALALSAARAVDVVGEGGRGRPEGWREALTVGVSSIQDGDQRGGDREGGSDAERRSWTGLSADAVGAMLSNDTVSTVAPGTSGACWARAGNVLEPTVVAVALSLGAAELTAKLAPSSGAASFTETVGGALHTDGGVDIYADDPSAHSAVYQVDPCGLMGGDVPPDVVAARAAAVAAATAAPHATSALDGGATQSGLSWVRSTVSKWFSGAPAVASENAAVAAAAAGAVGDAHATASAGCASVLLRAALRATRAEASGSGGLVSAVGAEPLAVLAARCPRLGEIWGVYYLDNPEGAVGHSSAAAAVDAVGPLPPSAIGLEGASQAGWGASSLTSRVGAALRGAASSALPSGRSSYEDRVGHPTSLAAAVAVTLAGCVSAARQGSMTTPLTVSHTAGLVETFCGAEATAVAMASVADACALAGGRDARAAAQLACQAAMLAVEFHASAPITRAAPSTSPLYDGPSPIASAAPSDPWTLCGATPTSAAYSQWPGASPSASHPPPPLLSMVALGPLAVVGAATASRVCASVATAWPHSLGVDLRDVAALVAVGSVLEVATDVGSRASRGGSLCWWEGPLLPLRPEALQQPFNISPDGVREGYAVHETLVGRIPAGEALAGVVADALGVVAGNVSTRRQSSPSTGVATSLRPLLEGVTLPHTVALSRRVVVALHALSTACLVSNSVHTHVATASGVSMSLAERTQLCRCVSAATAALEATGWMPCSLPVLTVRGCAFSGLGEETGRGDSQGSPSISLDAPRVQPADVGVLGGLVGPLLHAAAGLCFELFSLPFTPHQELVDTISVLHEYACQLGDPLGGVVVYLRDLHQAANAQLSR